MKTASNLFANTVWACQPDALEAFYAEIEAYFAAGVKGDRSRSVEAKYTSLDADGTLNVDINGMMISQVPDWFAWYGIEATGTHALTKELASYKGSAEVRKLQLNVNSPGGDTTGIQALANLVAEFGVPSVAKVNGMAASAAYWIASQADSVVASDINDTVGSIGVFGRVLDSSRLAKNMGTEFHLIRSGPNKGVGTPGVPVTTDNLIALQEKVDAIAMTFKDSVARGRGLDDNALAAVTDGRSFTAGQGLANGLVDKVEKVASTHVPSLATMPVVLGEQEGNSMADTFDAKAAIEAMNAKLAALETKNAELEKTAKANAELAAKTNAELEMKKIALAQVEATTKSGLIEGAVKAGKVLPAMRGMIEALADKFTSEELSKHLASLPTLVHSQAAGSTPAIDPGAKAQAQLTEEDRKVMKLFGLTEKQYQAADNFKSLSLLDREITKLDGSVEKVGN